MNSVGKDTCFIALVSTPISYALGIATFLIVSFQALERFIAIFYPFKYKLWVTKFVVIVINLTIWFISCSAVVCWMLSRNTRVFNIFIGVIIFTFSSVNIFCYYKIKVETKR